MRATGGRTAAVLALVSAVACRRVGAQDSPQITAQRSSVELTVGDTTTLRATVSGGSSDARSRLTWSSDNDAIAHVDRSGAVTARAPGVTGITASIGSSFSSTRVTVLRSGTPIESRAAAEPAVAPAIAAPAPPPKAAVVKASAPAPEQRVLPTRRDGVAAPPARPVAASSLNPRRSARSPHYSHISLFYTDFYSRYASPADHAAALSFLGARLDGVMGGSRDQWKGLDPAILHFPYALQFTVPLPGQKSAAEDVASGYFADMERWYASNPRYQMENAFLHRGGHDAAHRVQVKIWDSMRYAINPGDAGQREYQADRLRRVAQHEDGVFLDEFGGGMNGVSKTTDEFATASAYMAAETELITKVRDAIKPGFLLINIGEYWTPTDSALVVAGGGAHLERTNNPFTDRLVERWTQIDHLLALKVYTEFVTLWAYTDWVKSKSFPSFNGGMYSSPLERGQIVQLASYYMAVPADPSRLSLDQQNMWNVRPDTVWMPAVEVDVGHPREVRHSLSTGTDRAGQKYRIYARDFDHAYVVIRPQSDWRPQIYSDSTGVAVPLPSPMRPLHRDGTLGAAVSSVTLRNVEAAILFK